MLRRRKTSKNTGRCSNRDAKQVSNIKKKHSRMPLYITSNFGRQAEYGERATNNSRYTRIPDY